MNNIIGVTTDWEHMSVRELHMSVMRNTIVSSTISNYILIYSMLTNLQHIHNKLTFFIAYICNLVDNFSQIVNNGGITKWPRWSLPSNIIFGIYYHIA